MQGLVSNVNNRKQERQNGLIDGGCATSYLFMPHHLSSLTLPLCGLSPLLSSPVSCPVPYLAVQSHRPPPPPPSWSLDRRGCESIGETGHPLVYIPAFLSSPCSSSYTPFSSFSTVIKKKKAVQYG
ncbi:hypothetical protein L249_1328 [Ophiocordyceps polyrhachis-furcata BCC 54312]|uniref:Uncharacterized protein n=1 Tax=Ophiocordyceps polyrhachis-furcata BCC 54312 TaxID=1330021 RepID=A0A367LEU9_9HYPO|nr:hypothetical protein L249_1328 [Ophiocordyceps polyrhachis-furcata BCC 54312]